MHHHIKDLEDKYNDVKQYGIEIAENLIDQKE